MKILLVGGMSNDETDNESLKEFYEYMKGVLPDVAIAATYLDKISYDLSNEQVNAFDEAHGTDIKEYDTIYIRGPKMRLYSTYAYYLSRYAAARGIRCVNDYSLYYPGTKMAQQILFYEERAPFVHTLYGIDKKALINRAEKNLGYPFILKTNVGSHGDSNHLVRDRQAALAVLEEEPGVDFLAQAFYPNDRDYRVLIVGDEELIFERRGAEDSHINNTSKGAEATLADVNELPRAILDHARNITKYLNLEISGVDVMPHLETGQFVFLEVNTQPQLRTGAFLHEKQQLLRKLLG